MAEKEVLVIDLLIKDAEAAKSVEELSASIKDLNSAIKEVPEGSKDFKKLNNSISKTTKKVDDFNKSNKKGSKDVSKLNKALKKTGTIANKAAKGGLKAMGKGIKGIGKAFGAMGIGIVIAALAALVQALSKNQKVMDAVSAVMGTISDVMSQFVDILVDVYKSVSESSDKFDGLKKVMMGMVTLAITPLKLSFYAIKLAIQELQLGWEKSFLGDKDPETIKNLTAAIDETKGSIVEVGTAAIQSGKDIVNNLGDAISEATAIVSEVVTKAKEISIEAAYETAKANVATENAAKLAVSQQARLVEQYDRQAEQQRQLRDDESLSVAERTKANEKLGKILKEQEKAMIKQANLQIADAKAKKAINNNIDTQIALNEALANKEAILAQIEGFKSEQLVNVVALKKEENELNQAILDGDKERQLELLKYIAENTKNEEEKIKLKRKVLELELVLLKEDLEKKRLLYKEGTQARVDAEEEYKTEVQRINNEITTNEKEEGEKRVENSKKEADEKRAINEALAQSIIGGLQAVGNLANVLNQNEIKGIKLKYDTQIKAMAKAGKDTSKIEAKRDADIEALQKKQFERKKKMDMSSALIGGALAIINSMANNVLPFPASLIAPVSIGIITALEVATIAAQKFAMGGMVGPGNMPIQSNGDNVMATLKTGEIVLNEEQIRLLGGPQTFANIGVPGISVSPTNQTILSNNAKNSFNSSITRTQRNNTQHQKVYVLESDITKTQKTVEDTKNRVSIG